MIKVIEEYIEGKSKNCEDKIYKGQRFFAIIDGCTSKNKITYGDKSGGEMAADIILNTIKDLDNEETKFSDILRNINVNFDSAYEKNNIEKSLPENRMGAVFILFDNLLKKIYLIGDCQAILINKDETRKYISGDKKIDEVTSNARSVFNHGLIITGQDTFESLLEEDKGREFIMPLLLNQLRFENIDHEYGYPVINGNEVPESFIQEFDLKNTKRVIMASDGYPELCETLNESEEKLKDLLEKDPLMISIYKSTKGLQKGNKSFDDRAYISFDID